MSGVLSHNSAASSRSETRSATYVILALACVIFGIMIGYYAWKTNEKSTIDTPPFLRLARSKRSSCRFKTAQTPAGKNFYWRFTQHYQKKYACVSSREDCLKYGHPRNYIAYHLNRKAIVIDGKLDEGAWQEVPWSELFVDIRSDVYPKPYYDTKFKMRWDDDRLYIGAFLQEENLWATEKVHDSKLWTENSFSILLAVDETLFNYKQVEVNVLGTVMDLLMNKSYWDAPGQIVHDLKWESNAEVGIYTEGTVNVPGDKDKYWSVEISVPFDTLAERANRAKHTPTDNEVLFLQFARTQQRLINKDGLYQKAPNSTSNWWTWQPCDTINLHLQDRWGLVQFKRNVRDKTFTFQNWHIYKALFETLEAMKVYRAKNGVYTNAVEELDLPPYLLSRACVDVPEIHLRENRSQADFDITIKSMLFTHPPAYIRSDRFVIIK